MYKNYVKRFIDIILALAGTILLVFVFIVIAPLIYLEDKGPVFYIAPRMGKNGKIFKMYKFRSMRVNSPDLRNIDGSTYNSMNDSRLTRIGRFIRKTSLDEAPQVLNVLKGDMSVVGPRPFLPGKKYDAFDEVIKKSISVSPGITGYTQAYYRNSLAQDEKFETDCYYVDHISFIFDLKIFLKTINSVFRHENVYIDVQSPEIDASEKKQEGVINQ